MMNNLQNIPKQMTTTSLHALNKGAKKTKDTCTKVTTSISHQTVKGVNKTMKTCNKMTTSISHQATQGAKKTKKTCSKMTNSVSHQAVKLNRQIQSTFSPPRKVRILPLPDGEDLKGNSNEFDPLEITPPMKRDPLFAVYIKEILEENDDTDNLLLQITSFFEDKHSLIVADRRPATGIIVTLEALEMLHGHVLLLNGFLSDDVVEVAQKVFDAYMSVRFAWFCAGANITTLSPNEIATALRWLSGYRAYWDEQFSNNGFPPERIAWIEDLRNEYLRSGVHKQVRSMIDNRLQLLDQDEVTENKDRTLSTSLEYDVTVIVESQLSVAKESLPDSMLLPVLSACNEELLNLAGGLMFEIETKWKTMSVERLCSYVNDSQSLLDQFEQRNEALNPNYENDINSIDLLKECSLLSLHATRFLCERIFLDVREGVLEKVGTVGWVSGNIIDTVVTTLRDYFEDIKRWIPADYFFPKILKTCIDLILRTYVESFFSNTMAHGLDDRTTAVDLLQSDWLKLWEFFGTDNRPYHGCAGFYDKEALWHRLHILEVIAAILTSTSEPVKLQNHILVVLQQLGVDSGAPAILHLFGLQRKRVSSWETQQWHETIAASVEHAQMQGTDLEPLYQIADLRNSRFVKKLGRSRRNSSNRLDLSSINKLVGHHRAMPGSLIGKSRQLLGADRNLLTSWRLEEEL